MASSCKYTLSDVEFIFPVKDSFTAATFSCWNRFEAVPKRQKYVTGAHCSALFTRPDGVADRCLLPKLIRTYQDQSDGCFGLPKDQIWTL